MITRSGIFHLKLDPTSNTSSLPKVVGDASILVDSLDALALNAAFEPGMTDLNLAKRLRQAGVQRATPSCWGRTVRETVKWYRKVLGARLSQKSCHSSLGMV